MAESDDGFLSRWSRRKSETRDESERTTEAPERDTKPALGEGGAVEATDPERDAEIVAELPDIESLDESSDFAQFMQKGVPEAIRRKALRKLWRLNPVFANLDGLNDYDEDFTDAATVVAGLKTLYQVGKGMRRPDPAPEEPRADAEGEGEREETEPAQARSSDSAEPESETSPPTETDAASVAPASAGDDLDRAPPAAARTGHTGDAEIETEQRPHAAVGTPSASARRWGRFRS